MMSPKIVTFIGALIEMRRSYRSRRYEEAKGESEISRKC